MIEKQLELSPVEVVHVNTDKPTAVWDYGFLPAFTDYQDYSVGAINLYKQTDTVTGATRKEVI